MILQCQKLIAQVRKGMSCLISSGTEPIAAGLLSYGNSHYKASILAEPLSGGTIPLKS